MQPELRQVRQRLGNADLHVMTWNAFVVSHGFVVNQRSRSRVGHGHDDAAGPFPIRRATDVMGGRGFGEIRDRFHGYRRCRQQPEELRQLRLHLVDVFLKVIHDLLLAFRLPIRVGVDRFAEAGEILLSLGLCELSHFG